MTAIDAIKQIREILSVPTEKKPEMKQALMLIRHVLEFTESESLPKGK